MTPPMFGDKRLLNFGTLTKSNMLTHQNQIFQKTISAHWGCCPLKFYICYRMAKAC